MSIGAIQWAFEQDCGSPATKMVLVALADNADYAGICCPSASYMEQRCELSKATIENCIKKLESLGLIKIQERSDNGMLLPALYHLQLDTYSR